MQEHSTGKKVTDEQYKNLPFLHLQSTIFIINDEDTFTRSDVEILLFSRVFSTILWTLLRDSVIKRCALVVCMSKTRIFLPVIFTPDRDQPTRHSLYNHVFRHKLRWDCITLLGCAQEKREYGWTVRRVPLLKLIDSTLSFTMLQVAKVSFLKTFEES